MKSNTLTEPPEAKEQPQAAPVVKYLHYWSNRPRGLTDMSQHYSLPTTGDIDSFFRERGYTRLQDIQPGTVELWDRGTSISMHEQYVLIAHTHNPGQPHYKTILAVESFELLMMLVSQDNILSCLPLMPEMLLRYHAIQL